MDSELLTLFEFRKTVGNYRTLFDALSSKNQKTFLISMNNNPFFRVFKPPHFFIENVDKSKYNEYFYYTDNTFKKKRIILNQLYLPIIRKNLLFLTKGGFNLN